MIYTVTLNPALDRTIILEKIHFGSVNRSRKTILEAGGKGINVSKVVKNLGEKTIALGFIGDENEDTLLRKLDLLGIAHDFIDVPGETRTNIKIVETESNTFTDINQPGFEVSNSDIEKLVCKIKSLVKKDDTVVLSGSLPKGLEPDIYKNLVLILKDIGAKTILDTEGEALRLGIKVHPDIIKPNINELKGIINCTDDIQSVACGVRKVTEDSGLAIVSMGASGALLINNSTYFCPPLKVNVKSTVGAGDSMVAALAIGLSKGMDAAETFKLAVAASSAKITLEGTEAPSKALIYRMLNQVKIERRN